MSALALSMLAICTGPAPAEEPAGPRALFDSLLDASDAAGFTRPTGPWTLSLPGDHGAHPAARTESWTVSAHLDGPGGDPMAVQIVLSRFGLIAEGEAADGSAWAPRALYRGHVVLASAAERGTASEERVSRGAAGTAGHDAVARRLWLDDWSLVWREAADGTEDVAQILTVEASVEGVPLRLTLRPGKPALSAGGGEAPIRGYALPRLEATGRIGLGNDAREVSGEAWLDHLWGEVPLPGGPLAYDRLILHLDDGTDLSILRNQRRGGRGVPTVDALLVMADGTGRTLGAEGIEVTPIASWNGYPVAWQVRGAGLDLTIQPTHEDQRQPFLLPVWTGLVHADGTRDGEPVRGHGTLQLTGYTER